MSLQVFTKQMELALEFWSLPFQLLLSASANLQVFVAKCLGVSWDRLGLAWVSLGNPYDAWGGDSGRRMCPKGSLPGTDWLGGTLDKLSTGARDGGRL